MTLTFPGESGQYRQARDALLEQEIELRRRMEAVATARRELPPGGEVAEDYVFEEQGEDGTVAEVRLSELMGEGRSLAVYNYMFPRHVADDRPGPTEGESAALPLEEGPCPSCTALLDQLDAAAHHVAPHADLVVSAKAPIERLTTFARERGWRHLRLVSSAGNSYARDYGGEVDGQQQPMMNVFERDGAVLRHFWGSEMLYAPSDPEQDPRHMGTLEPSWNLFDLMRPGRGEDWDEQIDYDCCR